MIIKRISTSVLFLLPWMVCGLAAAQNETEQIFPLPAPDTGESQVAQPLPVATAPIPAAQPVVERYYRLKDITFPEGDRDNTIEGIGLVVGLSQTGGRAVQTQMMAQNYFVRQGLPVQDPETRSMSAVLVSGEVPPYARKGETIQVKVSVIDDSTSLRGGMLARTPLKGLDGKVYAIAQGPVLGGGVAAGGEAANVQRDHPTAGVCNATIEREICSEVDPNSPMLRLILRNKEYSTAVSVANTINEIFGRAARAVDQGTIEIYVPRGFYGKRAEFISVIGQLRVKVDPRAKVVVNQKTGTIILGQNVRIAPVVFAKGSLVISTTEAPVVSQPAPLSEGETVVLPRTSVEVSETGGPYSSLGGVATVGELGRALNELGFTPNMMIEMFSSLKSVGALQAELVIE